MPSIRRSGKWEGVGVVGVGGSVQVLSHNMNRPQYSRRYLPPYHNKYEMLIRNKYNFHFKRNTVK